jgi:hypothetical protein
MLAYGQVTNACDEHCRIGKNTSHECLKCLVRVIREIFEPEFLRQLTQVDLEKQMRMNTNRRWLGMFVSLDCMHYRWKICHVVWQGSFTNKDGNKSIILEVIANQRLWIWHAYFSLLKGNNDLNVLNRNLLI